MDYVTAKKIVSPYSGEWVSPKLIVKEYNDRIDTEAHWYCPASGKFITRGLVKSEPKVKDAPDNTEK